MKKSLVLGLLTLAAGALSSYGQGIVWLDNYDSSTYNPVRYSAEFGGGLVGAGFTVGLYYDPTANQNITGSIAADPTGFADPSTLNAAFIAATGPGSTASILSYDPGYFSADRGFLIQPDAAVPAQSRYTIMVVMYNGLNYDSSTVRGHSAAVYVQDASPVYVFGGDIGLDFPANTPMIGVPEPTTLALVVWAVWV